MHTPHDHGVRTRNTPPHRATARSWIRALTLLALLALARPGQAAQPYTAPTGDITGNAATDVQDIQCYILLFTNLVLAGDVSADQCTTDADCLAT